MVKSQFYYRWRALIKVNGILKKYSINYSVTDIGPPTMTTYHDGRQNDGYHDGRLYLPVNVRLCVFFDSIIAIGLLSMRTICIFFVNARRYASAVYAVIVSSSVRLSASHTSKRQNVGSSKHRHTTAQGLYSFLTPKISAKFQRGHHQRERQIRGSQIKVGCVTIGHLRPVISLYITKGARFGHSYYGTLIKIRMCWMEWFYFQLLWVSYPKPPPFSTFCIAYYIFVMSGDRDFKFGRLVDGSRC